MTGKTPLLAQIKAAMPTLPGGGLALGGEPGAPAAASSWQQAEGWGGTSSGRHLAR